MGVCKCGKSLRGSATKCRRCTALQELGLTHGANEKSIRSAYIGQVKAWHPDRHGNTKTQELAAEEKTKRINIAYKFLTQPAKRGDIQPPPSPPATTSSANRNSGGSAKPPSDRGSKEEHPLKASRTSVVQVRSMKKTVSTYPQPDFKKWQARFDELHIGGTNAAKGLKKWIRHEENYRASTIAFTEDQFKAKGLDMPNLEQLPQPKDAHADVMRSLWIGSAPNVEERNSAAKTDNHLLKHMEQLEDSINEFTKRLQTRGKKLATQDRFFEIPLDGLLQLCTQLSSSLRMVSILAKRKYIYPLDIADCCMSLVLELEDRRGISQRECHALIRCALIAHGCTPEQAAPFGEDSVERGTIAAKKESLRQKCLKSVDILWANASKHKLK